MLLTEIPSNFRNLCPYVNKGCDQNVTDENIGLIDSTY